MATTTDLDVQWYCESDIVAHTGLPGPLVAELLPRLPTLPGEYNTAAKVYDADTFDRALLVTQMLRAGVRLRFIRIAIAQPMTADQLSASIAEWTAPQTPAPAASHPWQSQAQTVITIALFALSALLLGIAAGIALGRP